MKISRAVYAAGTEKDPGGTARGFPVALARVVLTVAALASLIVALRPVDAAIPSDEFPVSSGSGNALSPAVSGKTVVWEQRSSAGSDVFFKDLNGGSEAPVTTAPGVQTEPDISGNVVVWEDTRGGDSDVYARDLSAPDGQEIAISTAPGDQRRPAVSGDTVVWEDDRSGDWEIYRYNLSTGRQARLTTDPADQRRPDVSGDTVVWQDDGGEAGNSDVYARDLSTGRGFSVAIGLGFQDTPVVSGDVVVWHQEKLGDSDILGKNLRTGDRIFVSPGDGDQWSPAVDGRIAVFADGRGGDPDIYGRDIETGRSFRVTRSSGGQEAPAVDGKTVVWESQRAGDTGFGAYEVNGATLDIAPAKVTNLSAAGVRDGVRLGWNPGTAGDLAGYNVYRGASLDGAYEKLNAAPLAEAGYLDGGAPKGSTSYYRVVAVDGAGSESAAATANAVAPVHTGLSLATRSTTVTLGEGTALSGRLTADGEPVAGARVIIQARPVGAASFGPVPGGAVTTGPNGGYYLGGVKPKKNTDYRARFAGNDLIDRSVSPLGRVEVKALVSASPSFSKVKIGQKVNISGLVRPVRAGSVDVVVSRVGTVLSRRTVPVADSSFRVTYRPPGTGTYAVRAVFEGNAAVAGNRSPARYFKVVR